MYTRTFKSISSEISVPSHPTSWINVSLKPIIVYDPHPHTRKSLMGKFLQAFYGIHFKCLRCKYYCKDHSSNKVTNITAYNCEINHIFELSPFDFCLQYIHSN